mgnify:CR=1 FL=1
MKVLLKYGFNKGPFLTDSGGAQRVLALIQDDLDNYVVFSDSIQNSTYIERVKNKFLDAFSSANLAQIISDEEYAKVLQLCVDEGIIKGI